MSEKMKTATQVREEELRIDRRRMRAEQLTAAVLKMIEPFLRDDDGRERRDAYYALMELFHQEGIEILSDHDRAALGLPARDSKGWSEDEKRALDALRLEAMLRPLQMTIPAPPPETERIG